MEGYGGKLTKKIGTRYINGDNGGWGVLFKR